MDSPFSMIDDPLYDDIFDNLVTPDDKSPVTTPFIDQILDNYNEDTLQTLETPFSPNLEDAFGEDNNDSLIDIFNRGRERTIESPTSPTSPPSPPSPTPQISPPPPESPKFLNNLLYDDQVKILKLFRETELACQLSNPNHAKVWDIMSYYIRQHPWNQGLWAVLWRFDEFKEFNRKRDLMNSVQVMNMFWMMFKPPPPPRQTNIRFNRPLPPNNQQRPNRHLVQQPPPQFRNMSNQGQRRKDGSMVHPPPPPPPSSAPTFSPTYDTGFDRMRDEDEEEPNLAPIQPKVGGPPPPPGMVFQRSERETTPFGFVSKRSIAEEDDVFSENISSAEEEDDEDEDFESYPTTDDDQVENSDLMNSVLPDIQQNELKQRRRAPPQPRKTDEYIAPTTIASSMKIGGKPMLQRPGGGGGARGGGRGGVRRGRSRSRGVGRGRGSASRSSSRGAAVHRRGGFAPKMVKKKKKLQSHKPKPKPMINNYSYSHHSAPIIRSSPPPPSRPVRMNTSGRVPTRRRVMKPVSPSMEVCGVPVISAATEKRKKSSGFFAKLGFGGRDEKAKSKSTKKKMKKKKGKKKEKKKRDEEVVHKSYLQSSAPMMLMDEGESHMEMEDKEEEEEMEMEFDMKQSLSAVKLEKEEEKRSDRRMEEEAERRRIIMMEEEKMRKRKEEETRKRKKEEEEKKKEHEKEAKEKEEEERKRREKLKEELEKKKSKTREKYNDTSRKDVENKMKQINPKLVESWSPEFVDVVKDVQSKILTRLFYYEENIRIKLEEIKKQEKEKGEKEVIKLLEKRLQNCRSLMEWLSPNKKE